MKKIVFKKLTVEGFGSLIKQTKFNFDKPGLNLLLGRVGSGKTTILSALVWALYGITLKKKRLDRVPTWQKYRTKSWKGTRVILEYAVDGIEYKVARHYKYQGKTWVNAIAGSSIELLIAGKEHSYSMKKAKQKIQESIGIDVKVFLNSVLFGQRMRKFIEAEPSEKRKIFELIFNLEFIDKARDKGKKALGIVSAVLSKLEAKKESNVELLENLQREYKEKNEILKQFDKTKEQNIYTYEKELADIINQMDALFLDSMKAEHKEYKAKDIKHADIQDEIRLLNEELRATERVINEGTTELAEKLVDCTQCGQRMSKAASKHRRAVVKKLSAEAIKNSKRLNKTLGVLEISRTQLIEELETLEEILTANAEDKQAVGRLKKTRKTFKSLLKAAKKEKLPNIDLAALESNIGRLSTDVEKIDKKHQVKARESKYLTWWITQGFANAGLKSYVMDSMLESLNAHLNKYVTDIGFIVNYSIDTSAKSKPFLTHVTKPDGQLVFYEELSGGEKSMVEIASVCAMHDMVTTEIDINILLLDEIFEGLGAEEMDDVFDIIKKKEVTSIFIITHRQFDAMNCNIINFSKKKNQTIIA